MKQLKFEVKRISDTDIIATSAPLFNSVEYRSTNRWLFYNVDLKNPDNRDTTKHIYNVDGTPACEGVDSELFETYKTMIENSGIPTGNDVYHYVNGNWVKCETYCGSTGIDHHTHQGF